MINSNKEEEEEVCNECAWCGKLCETHCCSEECVRAWVAE